MIGSKGMLLGLVLSLVVLSSLASSPIHYIENKKQWPAGFHFGADFPQMRVMLKDASIFFVQHSFVPDNTKSSKQLRVGGFNESHVHSPGDKSIATFELSFIDALQASIAPSGKQKTIYNYFYGNDPSAWTSAAAAYEEVQYRGIYEGIDLKIYSQGDQMKYDWMVSPCADARKIRLQYKGIQSIELRDENLVVESKLGEIVETRPYAYQVVNGQRRTVPAAFDIDDGIVSFIFPEGYDTNYELVIDPFLIFSSYSGSTLDNWGNTATPDSKGNLYSGGMVDSEGLNDGKSFPTTVGAFQTTHHTGDKWDIGILKYDTAGANLLYVTYLGGSGTETPQSLVVNANDELFILGATSSDDFPGTSGGYKGGTSVDPMGDVFYSGGTDLFVAQLSVDGSQLRRATYLGGKSNDGINFVSGQILSSSHSESPLAKNYGDQLRGDIITDADGNVYIATNTRSSDFPVINSDAAASWHGGTHDAVVAKFAPDLSVVWTRLIGGSSTDAAYSIKLASSGNILVAGGTSSTNLAGMNGLITAAPGGIDGWIMELSPQGNQVINGTYVGTSNYDQVYFIDIGVNGDVFAYGQTKGNYPIGPGKVYANVGSGQFLHRFTPNLHTTVFSTTFGKSTHTPDISPTAFLVNACDNIYMAGWGGFLNNPDRWNGLTTFIGGDTFGLPFTSDAWQKTTLGNDFYMMVLTGDGKDLVYATFLGGTASLTHVDGGTSRFDKRGIVYHAVCAGCGGRPHDFPSYNVPASRSENRSSNCNNAAFKFDLSSLRAKIQTNNEKLTAPNITRVCFPDKFVLQNLTIGGEIFEWKFGDGTGVTVENKDNIVHEFKKPGRYTVKLKAIDRSTCVGEDSTLTVVDVFLPDMHAGPDQNLCFGSSTHLEASGAANYEWTTISKWYTSRENRPLISPEDTTTYYVKMTDINGCVLKDTVKINVVPALDLSFDFKRVYDCQSRPYLELQNLSELKEGEEAAFFFGDGTSSTEEEVVHTYERDGIYTVSLRGTKEFCTYEVSKDITVVTLRVPNVITPGAEDGLNDSFKVVYGDPPLPNIDLNIHVKIMDRWGKGLFESKDYAGDWSGAGIDAGVYYFEVEVPDEVHCKGWIHLIK